MCVCVSGEKGCSRTLCLEIWVIRREEGQRENESVTTKDGGFKYLCDSNITTTGVDAVITFCIPLWPLDDP